LLEADGGCFLLIWRHYHISRPCGVIDGDMGLLVTRTAISATPLITDDQMPTHSNQASCDCLVNTYN